MARLLKAELIEIAGKFNLSLEDIKTWKPRSSNKISSSGYWKKIGFEFIKTCPFSKRTDKIYFYGKLSDYNNINIEDIVKKAIDKINSIQSDYSKYYYVVKDKELFIEKKDDSFFNSIFYIDNIQKYMQ